MNQKLNIAISLVNLNGIELLKPALTSLLNSDFAGFPFKLFYWDNGSNDGALKYIKSLNADKYIVENQENLGIVGPRIKLMNTIISENKWDAVLEIHSDMLFPEEWFIALLSKFDEKTGIMMPHIITQKEYLFDLPLLESLVSEHRSADVLYNTIAVHPWLLNIRCIQDIGYYNPIYKNHRCEDDDFMLRVLLSKYDIKAYKNSIVFHQGGGIRKKCLKKNKNEKLFEGLHHMSVSSFSGLLLRNGDPRIVIDSDNPYKTKRLIEKITNYILCR